MLSLDCSSSIDKAISLQKIVVREQQQNLCATMYLSCSGEITVRGLMLTLWDKGIALKLDLDEDKRTASACGLEPGTLYTLMAYVYCNGEATFVRQEVLSNVQGILNSEALTYLYTTNISHSSLHPSLP